MSTGNRMIGLMLVVVALAAAFWVLLLGPKRQQANELGDQVGQLRTSLAQAQSDAAQAATARRQFPADYQQLVLLGKAVPASDDTSSLLVELGSVARRSQLRFDGIQISEGGISASAAPAPVAPVAPATPTETSPPADATASGATAAVPAAATVPPTETAAALLPIGASIGTAGLGVMPYDLRFSGDFFRVADFIRGIDSMVHTRGSHVAVDGRLLTLDGFSLNGDTDLGFPHLSATFAVTTYLTPPSQGLTAGASPTAPAAPGTAAVPAATAPSGATTTQTAATTTPAAR